MKGQTQVGCSFALKGCAEAASLEVAVVAPQRDRSNHPYPMPPCTDNLHNADTGPSSSSAAAAAALRWRRQRLCQCSSSGWRCDGRRRRGRWAGCHSNAGGHGRGAARRGLRSVCDQRAGSGACCCVMVSGDAFPSSACVQLVWCKPHWRVACCLCRGACGLRLRRPSVRCCLLLPTGLRAHSHSAAAHPVGTAAG